MTTFATKTKRKTTKEFSMLTTTYSTKVRFIIASIFMLISSQGIAQEYGVIPPAVRAKMDANKLNGIPSYTGVVTAYVVHCEGLESAELIELQNRAQHLPAVQGITIQSTEIIEVICAGGTAFDQVKSIFSNLVSHITSITIENRIDQ